MSIGLGGSLAAGIIGSIMLLASDSPVPVSPGGQSGMVAVASRCPAFHWTQVQAQSIDLVVYRVPEADAEGPPEQVLGVTLPGSASGWTPSLAQCLEAGGRYAWSVRALMGEGESAWSSPGLFEVMSGPSEAELEEAMAVVRRYLERSETLDDPTPSPSGTRSLARATSRAGAGAAPGGGVALAPAEPAPLAPLTRFDLVLSGTTADDDGVLASDPSRAESDLTFASNDDFQVFLDNDETSPELAEFEVWVGGEQVLSVTRDAFTGPPGAFCPCAGPEFNEVVVHWNRNFDPDVPPFLTCDEVFPGHWLARVHDGGSNLLEIFTTSVSLTNRSRICLYDLIDELGTTFALEATALSPVALAACNAWIASLCDPP